MIKKIILILLITSLLILAGHQYYTWRIEKEYGKLIEEYRPAQFHPMTFGMYVDSASYLYIREHSSDYILREIELYDELSVDLFRIDCRHDMFLENDTESINKLDQAIAKIRTTDKKLMLGIYGVEKWFREPEDGDTWKEMYRQQTDTLMKRYHPEYAYILPEAPGALAPQITNNISTEAWVEFAEEIAKRIKADYPDTIIVVGCCLHHPPNQPFFTQLMSQVNDIDIMGNDPYSVDEMINTDNYLDYWHTSPDNKEMWITETWSNGNIRYERMGRSAHYIRFAVYYAQKKGFDGFILFGGRWSMHKGDKFKKLDTFYAYKEVIEEIRGNTSS